jgi:hypothetical protein
MDVHHLSVLSFHKAVNSYNRTASVTDERTSKQHWLDDTGRGKLSLPVRSLSY